MVPFQSREMFLSRMRLGQPRARPKRKTYPIFAVLLPGDMMMVFRCLLESLGSTRLHKFKISSKDIYEVEVLGCILRTERGHATLCQLRHKHAPILHLLLVRVRSTSTYFGHVL